LFAIAWLIALTDTTKEIMDCFAGWGPPRGRELQEAIFRTYRSGVALPLFLSLPTAFLAARIPRTAACSGCKLVMACPVIAFANITTAVIWIAIFVRYAWP
jgi:hypothetical protein